VAEICYLTPAESEYEDLGEFMDSDDEQGPSAFFQTLNEEWEPCPRGLSFEEYRWEDCVDFQVTA